MTLPKSLFAPSLCALLFTGVSFADPTDPGTDEKVLHLPLRSAGPGSVDPATGSTMYDNRAASMV